MRERERERENVCGIMDILTENGQYEVVFLSRYPGKKQEEISSRLLKQLVRSIVDWTLAIEIQFKTPTSVIRLIHHGGVV